MSTAGDLGTRADLDVANRAGLATHDDEIAQFRGAGNAGLADDHASRPLHEYGPAGLYTARVTVRTGRSKETCAVDINVP